MSVHPNLADTLREPDDGSMVIVASDCCTRLWVRNDPEASRYARTDGACWFADAEYDDEPHTWRLILQSATHVWACGDLLATSVEASR